MFLLLKKIEELTKGWMDYWTHRKPSLNRIRFDSHGFGGTLVKKSELWTSALVKSWIYHEITNHQAPLSTTKHHQAPSHHHQAPPRGPPWCHGTRRTRSWRVWRCNRLEATQLDFPVTKLHRWISRSSCGFLHKKTCILYKHMIYI